MGKILQFTKSLFQGSEVPKKDTRMMWAVGDTCPRCGPHSTLNGRLYCTNLKCTFSGEKENDLLRREAAKEMGLVTEIASSPEAQWFKGQTLPAEKGMKQQCSVRACGGWLLADGSCAYKHRHPIARKEAEEVVVEKTDRLHKRCPGCDKANLAEHPILPAQVERVKCWSCKATFSRYIYTEMVGGVKCRIFDREGDLPAEWKGKIKVPGLIPARPRLNNIPAHNLLRQMHDRQGHNCPRCASCKLVSHECASGDLKCFRCKRVFSRYGTDSIGEPFIPRHFSSSMADQSDESYDEEVLLSYRSKRSGRFSWEEDIVQICNDFNAEPYGRKPFHSVVFDAEAAA